MKMEFGVNWTGWLRTCCGSVGFKLGRCGKLSGASYVRLGLSVQCGFKDDLGGVQLFSDQTCPFENGKDEDEEDGFIVIKVASGLDDEEGLCLVINAGSVVTCQWAVCGAEPAALEWKKKF